jgi:hypothetical protein
MIDFECIESELLGDAQVPSLANIGEHFPSAGVRFLSTGPTIGLRRRLIPETIQEAKWNSSMTEERSKVRQQSGRLLPIGSSFMTGCG